MRLSFCFSPLCLDVDDEYEDEEDQWEEGAEDILEKGEKLILLRDQRCHFVLRVLLIVFFHCAETHSQVKGALGVWEIRQIQTN